MVLRLSKTGRDWLSLSNDRREVLWFNLVRPQSLMAGKLNQKQGVESNSTEAENMPGLSEAPIDKM